MEKKVRKLFRQEIQDILKEKYDFYAMTAHPDVNAEAYIKDHFQDMLGKLYSPYSDKGIFSLALDNDNTFKNENENLLAELGKHFYVKKVTIGENPLQKLEEARTEIVAAPSALKNGVLMVMMENYDNKSNQFLATGKLAIGIKYTKDSMEIVEHLTKIGYVLFHTRKDEGQHLFAIEDAPVIKSVSELDTMIYKNISTAEIYITLQLNPKELDSSSIHSSKKGYASAGLRYDAQYATLEDLN